MSREQVHIGMDDIDSPEGECTTHFASLLVEQLDKLDVEWIDYPNLIRLNPGIPYRTRGNGAVALRFIMSMSELDDIVSFVETLVHEYVEKEYPNTNPGVVIIPKIIPKPVFKFAKQSLWRLIPLSLAQGIINDYKIKFVGRGNGRGLIGALAAVGNTLSEDHTYEYIAYRSTELANMRRGVSVESVREMDLSMGERVFSNIDPGTDKIMIEPHGPDPVIFGVRGESAEDVVKASEFVKSEQSVERWMVFRTNQATGEHLQHRVQVEHVRPYMAAVVRGKVNINPKMIEGGHAIFNIKDDSSSVDCAAYEPTGEFRDIVMKLRTNDEVLAFAGVRPASSSHSLTLNLEGLEVLEVSEQVESSNPICIECGKRMKSAGSEKGFKCVKCGFKDRDATKIVRIVKRNLQKGLYLPPPRAQRHLTRPIVRHGKENCGIPKAMITKWHSH